MKAFQRNSQYISENFEQESGDGDWITQTPQMETTLEKISVYTGTTATQIVTYDKDSLSLEIGDTLLVDDGGTWKEIQVEGITEEPGSTLLTYNPDFSIYSASTNTSPIYLALGVNPVLNGTAGSGTAQFSPDGLRAWWSTSGGSYYSLRQFDLAEPYNLKSVTGTNSLAYVGTTSYVGFIFANKGKYLYIHDSSSAYLFRRYILSTPYDITTAGSPTQQYNTAWGSTYNFLGGAFNEDGSKVIIRNAAGVYYGTTVIPFNITGATFTSSAAILNTTSFTHDGRYMVEWYDDIAGVSSMYFKVYDMTSDPCNLASAATSQNYLTNIGATPTYWGSTSNNSFSVACISQNLKHISVIPTVYATQSIHALTTTMGRKITIDISTQGLSNAPTNGSVYLATKPVLKIASSPRTEAFTYDHQLYHTGATTTTANIHYNKSGVIAAGDSILIDGTTPVTLSSVTETTSNVTLTTADGLKYVGNYATGKSMYFNTSDGGFGPKFQLSTDGRKLFVLQGANTSATHNYSSGIYVYDLTIPWDITTATPAGIEANRHLFHWADLIKPTQTLLSWDYLRGAFFANSAYHNVCGFEFSPDGTKATIALVLCPANASIIVITLHLSRAWDLWSYASVTYPTLAYTGTTSASVNWRDMFFNTDGSQLILLDDYGNTSSSDVKYHPYSTTTPWIGSTAIPSTSSDISTLITKVMGTTTRLITRFTPDGKRLISLGAGNGATNGTGVDIANASFADLASPNNISSSNWPTTWTTFSSTYLTTAIKNNFNGVVVDHRFSPDGLRWYIMMDTGTIHQLYGNFNVDAGVMYSVTYPAQASAPTSIHIPDQSNTQTLVAGTPTSLNASYGTVTYTGAQEIISGARSVKFELSGPTSIDLQVNTVRIDLEKAV